LPTVDGGALLALYDDESVVAKWVENPTAILLWKKHFSTNCPVTNELAKMAAAVGVEEWRNCWGKCCELQ